MKCMRVWDRRKRLQILLGQKCPINLYRKPGRKLKLSKAVIGNLLFS